MRDRFSPAWVKDLTNALMKAELGVPLYEIAVAYRAEDSIDPEHTKMLCKLLRNQGYLYRSLTLAQRERTDRQENDMSKLVRWLEADLRVLSGQFDPVVQPPPPDFKPEPGRLLHIVGSALPAVTSSYTTWTHAIAGQESRLGLTPLIVTQMGIGDSPKYVVEDVESVRYQRIPGPKRGSIPFDEWMELYVTRLAAVVRRERPSVLVPASDFVNALAARAISREYNLPIVFDLRGLWEDSWLKRIREKYRWTDDMLDRWGRPDVWRLRRDREASLLTSANAVVAINGEVAIMARELGVDDANIVQVESASTAGLSYLAAYERVGAAERGAVTIARLDIEQMTADLARRYLDRSPRRDVDRITIGSARGTSQSIQDEGWTLGRLAPIPLDLPLNWATIGLDNRTQGFYLHAWDFMGPLIQDYSKTGDADLLSWCVDRACSWAEAFNADDDLGTMAWYDMSLGQRAPRLAYLLREAAFRGADDDTVETLARAVVRHQRELFAPRAFQPRTNHGFYTAVGQMVFARILSGFPHMELLWEQGVERLNHMANTQFAEDGGHVEHSPFYHRMLLESFLDAIDDGLITDPGVIARLERASKIMSWYIRPDGSMVPLGDSPTKGLHVKARACRDPHTLFLASNGRKGSPNESELLVLPDSGYAVVRSPQPRRTEEIIRSGYLTLMAAFHSRTHKHADDLSITWFDRGSELLIDAGRFGYLDLLPTDSPDRGRGFFYGRPERQYIERTRAHNTVECDGEDHNRQSRTPYGSGITGGEWSDGFFRISGEVAHEEWIHQRTLIFCPGNWLLCTDQVTATDDRDHNFRVWWNLSGELTDPQQVSSGIQFGLPSQVDAKLALISLDESTLTRPVKGAVDPLRGWRSARDFDLTPAWNFNGEILQVRSHTFETLLTFDQEAGRTRPDHPFV